MSFRSRTFNATLTASLLYSIPLLIYLCCTFLYPWLDPFSSKYCGTSSNSETELMCKFFLNNPSWFTYLWNDRLLICTWWRFSGNKIISSYLLPFQKYLLMNSSLKCISCSLKKLISIRFTIPSSTNVTVEHAHWYT